MTAGNDFQEIWLIVSVEESMSDEEVYQNESTIRLERVSV